MMRLAELSPRVIAGCLSAACLGAGAASALGLDDWYEPAEIAAIADDPRCLAEKALTVGVKFDEVSARFHLTEEDPAYFVRVRQGGKLSETRIGRPRPFGSGLEGDEATVSAEMVVCLSATTATIVRGTWNMDAQSDDYALSGSGDAAAGQIELIRYTIVTPAGDFAFAVGSTRAGVVADFRLTDEAATLTEKATGAEHVVGIRVGLGASTETAEPAQ